MYAIKTDIKSILNIIDILYQSTCCLSILLLVFLCKLKKVCYVYNPIESDQVAYDNVQP